MEDFHRFSTCHAPSRATSCRPEDLPLEWDETENLDDLDENLENLDDLDLEMEQYEEEVLRNVQI